MVYPQDPAGEKPQPVKLPLGKYVDAEADPATHRFKNWKGHNPGEGPTFYNFDPKETYYLQIHNEVQTARDAEDVH
jgi:hypothetical protein